jgi:hypothetical protein
MRLSRCILIVLTLALCALPTFASELYSLDSLGAGGTVYTLNQSTAAETLVGPVGAAFGFPGDLTSDTNPGTFRIWANDITTRNLLKINPATGTGTPIGLFTQPSGAPVTMVSLAFDSTTGRLYGNTSSGFSGEPDKLYSIDPNTAISTPIGQGIGFDNVFALGFNKFGKLYGVSDTSHQLILIDTALGSGGLVAPVAPTSIFDLAVRPEDGTAFVVDSGTVAGGTNSLYKIDLATGMTTLVGPHTALHNMVGLAFGPVPEPGTFTLLAIGATIASLRRKR